MVDFEDFNMVQLRKIVRAYNLDGKIPFMVNKMRLTKDELIAELRKHLEIDENGIIKFIQVPARNLMNIDNIQKPPRKPRAKKAPAEKPPKLPVEGPKMKTGPKEKYTEEEKKALMDALMKSMEINQGLLDTAEDYKESIKDKDTPNMEKKELKKKLEEVQEALRNNKKRNTKIRNLLGLKAKQD